MADDGSRKPTKQTQFGVTPPSPAIARAVAPSTGFVPSIDTELTEQVDLTLLATEQLAPGIRIHQYELIRELGRGGMGIVWAARDVKLGRRVAMKFIRKATREIADRFLIEARATARCSHDHIVIIHAVDEYADMPYMVLEFLEGDVLRGIIGEFGDGTPLPPSRVIELVLPIARALERAHELGIVHRDLKPENVFVTDAGQVKVLDFGIAKAFERGNAPNAARLADLGASEVLATNEGALVGTLPYMSPEQLGVDTVDHRSDLWALGVIMFEMLTGKHPVAPFASDALIDNLLSAAPMRSVHTLVRDVPDALAELVASCLQKPKADRIASAGDLARRLEDLPGKRGRSLDDGESPYPGLSAFQESDAQRFFGRSRDIARMVTRIRERPLTCVVGPSGIGKSSFIRAGVGPALKSSGETWGVLTLRPGRHPIEALAGVVERIATRATPEGEPPLLDHDRLVAQLRHEPGYLGLKLREHARATGGSIVMFIDQFEELYTLVPELDERRAFTAALAGVADDPAAPVRVVISLRSDFLDRTSEDVRFMEELSRGLVFLAPMDQAGLREALVEPVELVGYRYESTAMVGDMLQSLSEAPGALPLLQFAAAKLWDARDRGRRMLTVASYGAIGGITGALATHADEVIAGTSAAGQRLARKIFRKLVTPERTRAIVELSDLHELGGDRDDTLRLIEQLVAARLLVIQTRPDGECGSVEIVHESLIVRWPTLRRWLDEDQEDAAFLAQLGAAAKQWDAKGRPAGLLWRGDAMEEARRWYAHRRRTPAPASWRSSTPCSHSPAAAGSPAGSR